MGTLYIPTFPTKIVQMLSWKDGTHPQPTVSDTIVDTKTETFGASERKENRLGMATGREMGIASIFANNSADPELQK
jgi:hypothetical protein